MASGRTGCRGSSTCFGTATAVPFPPFDRDAMFEASRGRSIAELLDTFDRERAKSLARLDELKLTDADLLRHGRHPEFGIVTMGQHLATWVAHDLGHIRQVVRVMARQYTDAVGPWRAYLSILPACLTHYDERMIRKLASGKYRLYSRKRNPKTGKRRNLGTFSTRAAAERHERAVQFFKRR